MYRWKPEPLVGRCQWQLDVPVRKRGQLWYQPDPHHRRLTGRKGKVDLEKNSFLRRQVRVPAGLVNALPERGRLVAPDTAQPNSYPGHSCLDRVSTSSHELILVLSMADLATSVP